MKAVDEGQLNGLKQEAYALIQRVNSYIAYLRKTRQGAED
jgi:hypothetical protein